MHKNEKTEQANWRVSIRVAIQNLSILRVLL